MASEGSTPSDDPLVQYIVLRKDLVTDKRFKWTAGMMAAQVAHAATSAIWKHRDEPTVQEYMRGADGGTMRKVVTEVADEQKLRDLGRELTEAGIPLHEWCEQPENMLTCTALVPCRRSALVGDQTLGDFMKARSRLYR